MFEFPDICKEADDISDRSQKEYTKLLKLFLALLMFSSFLYSYFGKYPVAKFFNALAAVSILMLSLLVFFVNYQGKRRSAGTAAYSIRTVCWKYAMKTAPFDRDDAEAQSLLIEEIQRIAKTNRELKSRVTANSGASEKIPETMTAIRQLPISDRLSFYHKNRLEEQQSRYQRKTEDNRKMSAIFLGLLVFIAVLVALFLLLDLLTEIRVHMPIELLLLSISILFAWVQTTKYNELEKSCELVSYEIDCIALEKEAVRSEQEFSAYVTVSERFFSGEGAQWVAQKNF